jgi:hypothetical protein
MKLKPSQKMIIAFAMCVVGTVFVVLGTAMTRSPQNVFTDTGALAQQVPDDDTAAVVAATFGYVLAGIGGLALAWQILMAVVRAIARTASSAVKGKDE